MDDPLHNRGQLCDFEGVPFFEEPGGQCHSAQHRCGGTNGQMLAENFADKQKASFFVNAGSHLKQCFRRELIRILLNADGDVQITENIEVEYLMFGRGG